MSDILEMLPAERDRNPNITARLIIGQEDGTTGQIIEIGGKEIVLLGRNKSCEVPIEEITVSRAHAAIYVIHGTIHIMDLGSSHGTFVSSEKIAPKVTRSLHSGDILKFGKGKKTFKLVVDVSPAPSSSVVATSDHGAAESAFPGELTTQQQNRLARQEAIAAFALEMSSTVPVFAAKSVATNCKYFITNCISTSFKCIFLLDYVDGDDVDGATVVMEDRNPRSSGAAAGDESDSDDYGPQPSALATISNVSTRQVQSSDDDAEDKGDSDLDGQDMQLSKEESFDRFALENKIPISHQVCIRG